MLGRYGLPGLALGVALGRSFLGQIDDPTPVRALFAPEGRSDPLEIIPVLRSDRRPGCADFIDYRVFGHGLRLQQFLGSTDDRCLQARASTRLLDLATNRSIRKMCAIPRDQIVHAVHSRDSDVESVNRRLARNDISPEQPIRELVGLAAEREQWNIRQQGQSPRSRSGISPRGFVHDRLRHE